MLKIATWNVNSIKARNDRLLTWLGKHSPDILCLQELKVEEAAFPHEAVREAGYHALVHGQRTYNGVAILARKPLQHAQIGFGDDRADTQARFVEASVFGLRVMSVYVPNGGDGAGDKWTNKLAWLDRLVSYLERAHKPSEPLLLCGDLNIAPDDKDVARPAEWQNTVLCRPEVRAQFARLIDWGFVDVMRKHHPEGGPLSWWDYRMLSFPKGNGLRIDHILATPPLAAVSSNAGVDREQRKGKQPSDHAPVYAELDWTT